MDGVSFLFSAGREFLSCNESTLKVMYDEILKAYHIMRHAQDKVLTQYSLCL
jgi:hypothetical protein